MNELTSDSAIASLDMDPLDSRRKAYQRSKSTQNYKRKNLKKCGMIELDSDTASQDKDSLDLRPNSLDKDSLDLRPKANRNLAQNFSKNYNLLNLSPH